MIDLTCVRIEPLTKDHGRGAFHCGTTPIDNFVRNNVRKDHEAYKIRAFVACEGDRRDVLGLYCLTITSVDANNLGEGVARKFQRVKFSTPAIYLSTIAVAAPLRKSGLADLLMGDVFRRCLNVSEQVGAYAITLDAIHEKVARRYEEFGFTRFVDGDLKLFVPLHTIRTADTLA